MKEGTCLTRSERAVKAARCAVEGCEAPNFVRGWCQKHYGRWQRHGDPEPEHLQQRECANCPATFTPGRAYRGTTAPRFCSPLCADLAAGRRLIGPKGHAITCEMCGNRSIVPDVPAKSCLGCRDEWTHQTQTAWKARNPERIRAYDRTPERRAYQRAKYKRRVALKRALRVQRAAAEVARPSLLMLEAGPTQLALPAPEPRIRGVSPLGPTGPFTAGCCPECGEPFVVRATQVRHRFCSVACSRAEPRRRRRARKRDAFVARVYARKVFERDGWRCQLCGKKVRVKAKVPHPLAPTVDHVVPLACGGEHSMINVQTAHFICNSRKQDAAMNEQLRLVA